MPFIEGYELVAFAIEANCEENLMNRWIACYQTEMSFEQFKQEIGFRRINLVKNENLQSVEQVLNGLCAKFG